MEIRKLQFQNHSLMMKWLWRLAADEKLLWIEVHKTEDGLEDRWSNNRVNTPPYVVCVWRAIRNLWPSVVRKSSLKVGNGMKVSSF